MKRMRLIFAAIVLSFVAACGADLTGPDVSGPSYDESVGTLGSGV